MFTSKIVVLANRGEEPEEDAEAQKISATETKSKQKSKFSKKSIASFAILGSCLIVYTQFPIVKETLFNKILSVNVPTNFFPNEENKAVERKTETYPVIKLPPKPEHFSEKSSDEKIENKPNNVTGENIESFIKEKDNVEFPEVKLNIPPQREAVPQREPSLAMPPDTQHIDDTNAQEKAQEENVSTNKDTIIRELHMLLKNANYSIGAKKEALSLFINNINYPVGEKILNNNKFYLKNIETLCVDNELPIIKFAIADITDKTVLFEKEIKYSDNKKIVLSFDALSITDLETKKEEIYLPDETIFKNFKLSTIAEIGSDLKFQFACENRTIAIIGKELAEIK